MPGGVVQWTYPIWHATVAAVTDQIVYLTVPTHAWEQAPTSSIPTSEPMQTILLALSTRTGTLLWHDICQPTGDWLVRPGAHPPGRQRGNYMRNGAFLLLIFPMMVVLLAACGDPSNSASSPTSSPAQTAPLSVYFSSDALCAIDARDGSVRWNQKGSQYPVLENGVICAE